MRDEIDDLLHGCARKKNSLDANLAQLGNVHVWNNPSYDNQHVVYTVRKRNNVATVTLNPMVLSIEPDADDEVMVGFQHDIPLDGADPTPAPAPADPPPAPQ